MERQTAKSRDQIVDRLLFERHITPEEAEILREPRQVMPELPGIPWWSPPLPTPLTPVDMLSGGVMPCLFEEAAKRGEAGPLCLSCPCPRCTPRCVSAGSSHASEV